MKEGTGRRRIDKGRIQGQRKGGREGERGREGGREKRRIWEEREERKGGRTVVRRRQLCDKD